MLAITTTPDERLTPARRAKLAYIYVRQSSVTQVKHHQESTELQYRLVDRAVDLGWPRERVQVIDEDLGKSGAGHADRQGFQKLIAEIGLGNAGLVVSLDASRLARNNRDWHQLLELCSVFGADRGWRAPLRPARLPRPSAARSVRHHERGRASPNPDAPSSGRASESGTRRIALAVARWTCSRPGRDHHP